MCEVLEATCNSYTGSSSTQTFSADVISAHWLSDVVAPLKSLRPSWRPLQDNPVLWLAEPIVRLQVRPVFRGKVDGDHCRDLKQILRVEARPPLSGREFNIFTLKLFLVRD